MVSETVIVVNKAGFHMRPAGLFVETVSRFRADVTLRYKGRTINGKSIMNVMAACMKQGAELELVCDGADEDEALAAAVALIQGGLGADCSGAGQ